MKVQTAKIEHITPYARNPRKNAEAVAGVAASLKEFGWQQPIVVDREMVIIVGHTRYLAAQKLGMTEVPITIADKLTPEQIKAYRIIDNRSNEIAEWDFEMLNLEINEIGLDFTDFDLPHLDFPIINPEDLTDEEQPKLDELDPKIVTCPDCGHQFDAHKK